MLTWTKASSGNLFAETGPTSRYWICYRGNGFRLEHVTIVNEHHDWEELGVYENKQFAQKAAESTEKDNGYIS